MTSTARTVPALRNFAVGRTVRSDTRCYLRPGYCIAAGRSLDDDVRAFLVLARQVVDPRVENAANSLQELDPRIAEMLPGVLRPKLLEERDGNGAEEAAGRMRFTGGGFFFHISSPSSPRSTSYSLTWRGWGKGRPWRSADQCGGAVF